MKSVVIPLELAQFIDRVFLPRNPNKMRVAAPETIEAVRQFKALVAAGARNTP
jgi:hypothetical protein